VTPMRGLKLLFAWFGHGSLSPFTAAGSSGTLFLLLVASGTLPPITGVVRLFPTRV
jgi:hypothetical protein